jgi:hypothetical protein
MLDTSPSQSAFQSDGSCGLSTTPPETVTTGSVEAHAERTIWDICADNFPHTSKTCTARVISTLQNLSGSSRKSSSAGSCASTEDIGSGAESEATTHKPDDTDSPEPGPGIDQVLKRNQDAIDSVDQILACPCSANSELALMVVVIIYKIISWYQAILDKNDSTSTEQDGVLWNHDAASGISNPAVATSSSAALSRANPEAMTIPPISIGGYELEAEHRTRVIAQLVLNELGKISRVVVHLSLKFRGLAGVSSVGGGADSDSTGLAEDDGLDGLDGLDGDDLEFPLDAFVRCRLRWTKRRALAQLRCD